MTKTRKRPTSKVKWHPPETVPKDGRFILITTAGPGLDFAYWDGNVFRDYFYKQKIAQKWPYMIAWAYPPAPAIIKNTEEDTRIANGWKKDQ